MAALVLDPGVIDRLKAEREESGADRYDEVWDGVYVVPPLPNDEHQQLVIRLGSILQGLVDWPGLGDVRAGVNVSDRAAGWEHNYRVPDVAVFLRGGRARNHGTHWEGEPDLVIEIISPRDQTRDKIPFYEQIGVRELVLVDRDPWALELYQLRGNALLDVGHSTPGQPTALAGAVLPLTFRLVPQVPRPGIEVVHLPTKQLWTV